MRALFVDDEVEFLELMEKRLTRRGMEVVTAPDGQSALDLLDQALVIAAGPVGLRFKGFAALLALGDALAAPFALLFAQGRALMGGQGAHHIAVQNLVVAIGLLKILDGAGIGLGGVAAGHAVGTCLGLGAGAAR